MWYRKNNLIDNSKIEGTDEIIRQKYVSIISDESM